MLRLVAKYADAWNWWGWDETVPEIATRLGPIVSTLQTACENVQRDFSSLERTFDLYTVVPSGLSADGLDIQNPVTGSPEEIASFILSIGELGFDEVRCDLFPKTTSAIEAMQPVVELVHGE